MFAIESIHHISIPVTDLERSRHFYAEILGLNELERPSFDVPGAWYQLGEQQLHLIVHDKSTFREGKPVDPADIHLAIRVRSYHETKKFLHSKGFDADAQDDFKRIIEMPNSIAGWLQLYIMDPDRNVIELNAEQPDEA